MFEAGFVDLGGADRTLQPYLHPSARVSANVHRRVCGQAAALVARSRVCDCQGADAGIIAAARPMVWRLLTVRCVPAG